MKKNNLWPELLLDEDIVRRNVRRMKARADDARSILRPHFKTHQSVEIGEWLREEGVSGITVSSVGMAEYFANAGWKDILIAIPVNILLLERISSLTRIVDRLILLVDHPDSVTALAGSVHAEIVVEIDTGSNRTGIPSEDILSIKAMMDLIDQSDGLIFAGLYSHAGHHYRSRGVEEIRDAGNTSLSKILRVRDALDARVPVYFGDTPYASVSERLGEITVMTPGNFVFYDCMQMEIGSCSPKDIAVCVACPVISLHPKRDEIVIHCGGVHLAKDTLDDGSYGRIVRISTRGWSEPLEGYKVRSISQEHGVVALPEGESKQWKIGDVLGILPVHSCMTAEAMGAYRLLDDREFSHYRKKKPV